LRDLADVRAVSGVPAPDLFGEESICAADVLGEFRC